MEWNAYIDQWINAHREELVRDISRLVAVKSVKGEAQPGMPFGPGPAQALKEALELCQGYGFAVKNYDNCVGTADLNDKPSMVDILCHLDVVGEGDGWSTDPYTAVEQDGMLYGRGTDDDKGPLAAALLAMRAVKESGVPMKYNARLIMGTDEESGSEDLPHYYAHEQPAPNTFSPDASFPVYNTEKGGFHAHFTKSWAKTEALPRVSAFEGGFRFNVIPGTAAATVLGLDDRAVQQSGMPTAARLGVELKTEPIPGGVRLTVTGTGAHAAEPETGNNPITALVQILLSLPLTDCESTTALQQISTLLPHGDYSGKALGIAMEDVISGPLTLSFTLMKLDETGFDGGFDSRVPLCATEENCRNAAAARFTENGFHFDGGMRPVHHTPAATPFVQTLLSCYEEFSGLKGECLSMGGGTYVHDIEGGVAFGAGMPGFESNLHGANEHISIENMLTAAKIFAAVIARLCQG